MERNICKIALKSLLLFFPLISFIGDENAL